MKRGRMSVRMMLCGCALGITALMAVGCAPAASTGGYTISDGSIDVSGSSLTVTLESDPATGYEWDEMIVGDGVEFGDDEQQSNEGNPEGDENTVEYDTFLFTGTSEGTQTITFNYVAPDVPDGDVKTVTIDTKTNASGQFIEVNATGSDGSSGSFKG